MQNKTPVKSEGGKDEKLRTQGEVSSASADSDATKTKDFKSPLRCYGCNKIGHLKRDCKASQNSQKGNFMGKKPSSGGYNTHNCAAEEVDELSEPEEEVNSSRAKIVEQGRNDSVVMEVQVVGQAEESSDESFNCSYGYSKNKSFEAVIQADVIAKRPYTELLIGDLPKMEALIDSGSEICCIDSKYVKELSLPVERRVKLSGLRGQASTVDVVKLKVKKVTPDNQVNIAPPVHVWFAVVPELNEKVIITLPVEELLNLVASFNVPGSSPCEPVVSGVDSSVPTRPLQAVESASESSKIEKGSEVPTKVKVVGDIEFNLDGVSLNLLFDENKDGGSKTVVTTNVQTIESGDELSIARSEELAKEQAECPKLQHICRLAKNKKGGFFVEDGLIYHRDKIYGYNVQQLVLPESRYPVVLSMAHDAPFAGHMAAKATKNRVKLHFYLPGMDKVVKDYCNSCDV